MVKRKPQTVDPVTFVSVCSGIEAFSLAIDSLGWKAVAYSEIEPFPCAVLHERFGCGRPINMPDPEAAWIDADEAKARATAIKTVSKLPVVASGRAPNLGDMTTIDVDQLGHVDWLVGGTPCQSFSVAGLRRGLDDERGNLTLQFVRLAHELAARNGLRGALWENVPGCLSDRTNAFGCFLGALVGHDAPLVTPHGGRWPDAGMVAGPRARLAWRILDSQHFGVPQRRRRVFVVVNFGNGPDPAAVLFEPGGEKWRAAQGRQARQDVAGTLGGSSQSGGVRTTDLDNNGALVPTLTGQENRTGNDRSEDGRLVPTIPKSGRGFARVGEPKGQDPLIVTHALKAEGADGSEDGTGRGVPMVAVDTAPTMRAGGNRTGGHRPPGSDVDTIEMLAIYEGNAEGGNADIPSLSPSNTGKTLNNQTPLVSVYDQNQITNPDNRSQPADEISHALPAQGNAPVLFTITPGDSNKNYNARENPHSQALTGNTGKPPSARGGDLVVYPLNMRNASRSHGDTGVGTPGTGIGDEGDPSPTIMGGPVPAIAFNPKAAGDQTTLGMSETGTGAMSTTQVPAVALNLRGRKGGNMAELGTDQASALRAGDGGSSKPMAMTGPQVRRLIPEECEKLQGMPMGWTRIRLKGFSGWRDMGDDEDTDALLSRGLEVKQSKATGKWRVRDPDGPRYKSLGNSFTTEPVNWIMTRADASMRGLPMPDWQPMRLWTKPHHLVP